MPLGLRRRQQSIVKLRRRWPRRLAAVVVPVVTAGGSDDDRRVVSGTGDVVHGPGLGVNPVDGAVFLEPPALDVDGDDLFFALGESGPTVVRRSTSQGECWNSLHHSGP